MENTGFVRGYKVFNPDWTCRNKQYTCPGTFEENVEPIPCKQGIHFCTKAVDCFNYYDFNPNNHVAEVIAYGDTEKDNSNNDSKYVTDKLEIVREIPWSEVLELVNTGKNCEGFGNSGNNNKGSFNSGHYNKNDCNSGSYNVGRYNSGTNNEGDCNSGTNNEGSFNSGDSNVGDYNSGDSNVGNYNNGYHNNGGYNSGSHNKGYYNNGHDNKGDCNTGDQNDGNSNSGNHNIGHHNSGNYNKGNYNSGCYNKGNHNSGNWNKCDYSNGSFNTMSPKIYLFNKPSDLTYAQWEETPAYSILCQIPQDAPEFIPYSEMTDKDKDSCPYDAKTTKGYLKTIDRAEERQEWWDNLTDGEKDTIRAIPNFDKNIFEEIIGIKIDN